MYKKVNLIHPKDAIHANILNLQYTSSKSVFVSSVLLTKCECFNSASKGRFVALPAAATLLLSVIVCLCLEFKPTTVKGQQFTSTFTASNCIYPFT